MNGVGAPNGPIRFGGRDGWFRYPAGFSPEVLSAAIARLPSVKPQLVLDPFAGAGIGARHIAELGLRFRGIEANPLVAELAELKFSKARSESGELTRAAACLVGKQSEFDASQETDLVRACFPADTLAVLVSIRERIKAQKGPWERHLKWALLATLRDVATSKVGWPYQRPAAARRAPYRDVESRFLARVESMRASLPIAPEDVRIVQGDSRSTDPWKAVLSEELATCCLTSPPYLNNYDYADATRLEAYFWGDARSWASLVQAVRKPMMTSTTQQTLVGQADAARTSLASFTESWTIIRELECRLSAERQMRPRGKEYDRLLVMYCADAASVLTNLKASLGPGAVSVVVLGDSAPYGVYVDTPRLWAMLAEDLGFDVMSTEVIRNRGLRWRSNGTRHQVPLAEKLVLLRSPRFH